MTTNYTDLPDSELDRLAAIEIMGYRWVPYWQTMNIIDDDDGKFWQRIIEHEKKSHESGYESWRWVGEDGRETFADWDPEDINGTFCPTNPDSNQCEQYLFPKIEEIGSYIYMERIINVGNPYTFHILVRFTEKMEPQVYSSSFSWHSSSARLACSDSRLVRRCVAPQSMVEDSLHNLPSSSFL